MGGAAAALAAAGADDADGAGARFGEGVCFGGGGGGAGACATNGAVGACTAGVGAAAVDGVAWLTLDATDDSEAFEEDALDVALDAGEVLYGEKGEAAC